MEQPKKTNTEPARAPQGIVLPTPIIEMNFAFAQSIVLLTAVELNLFTHIAHGHTTASQLAEQAQANEPALLRLLGALCALGLLQKQQDHYALTPISERYLVRNKPTYIGDTALQTRQEWDAWIHLTDTIRSGQSFRHINENPVGGPFNAPLAEYLFPVLYPVMKRLCQRLEIGQQHQGLRIADLGAGTAPSAIAVLEQDRAANAIAIDFAEVLERAKIYARQHEVQDRITFQDADLATVTLPLEHFDLIFVSHVCRVVGPDVTQHIIHQSFRALKPGGRLIIVESYRDPENFARLFPHIISLNMLLNTRSGEAFSIGQMQEWLHREAFTVEVVPGIAPDPILIATRPLDV